MNNQRDVPGGATKHMGEPSRVKPTFLLLPPVRQPLDQGLLHHEEESGRDERKWKTMELTYRTLKQTQAIIKRAR